MRFEVRYGLRKTRQNLRQLLLLGFSLCAVSVVFVILMAIGEHILKDRPDWLEDNAALYTLGRAGVNGSLMPVSTSELQVIRHFESVKHSGSIALYEQTRKIELTNQTEAVTLAFFDEGVQAFFIRQVQEAFDTSQKQPKVWVSEQLWRTKKWSLPEIGETIYLGDDNHAFILAGVLPRSMGRIGTRSIDFWLSESFFPSLFKMKVQLPSGLAETDVKHLLNEAKKTAISRIENRYIVFESKKIFLPTDFLAQLTSEMKTVHSNVSFTMLGGGGEYELIQGAEFAPQVKDKLTKQFWVLLFFLLGLALVTFFNVVAFVSTQLVQRKSELSIRIVLGSSLSTFFKQFSLEALPVFAFSLSLSALVLGLNYQYFASSEKMIEILGTPLPEPGFLSLGISFAALILFGFAAFLLPCFSIFSQGELFSRQQGAGETKKQALFQSIITTTQMIVAGLSILFTIQYFHQQWKQKEIRGFDKLASEYQIVASNSQLITIESVNQLLLTHPRSAFSTASFIDPDSAYEDVKINGTSRWLNKRVQVIQVSENYFSVLKANYSQYGKLDEQSVIVNKAALAYLGVGQETPLNQFRLNIADVKYRIAGVIDNLPHYGQHNRDIPMVYSLFRGKTPALSGFVISKELHLDKQTQENSLATKGIFEQQLKQFDNKRFWFIYLSLGLLFFLFLVTLVALYFHSMARLKKRSRTFATMLAIGISDESLLYQCSRLFIMPLIITLCVIALLFSITSMMNDRLIEQVSYSMLTAGLLVLIVSALSYSGYNRLVNPPISALFKDSV